MDELRQILNIPGLKGAAQIGVLLTVRIVPIILMTPIFGGQTLPRRLRLGVAMFLALSLLPAFAAGFSRVLPADVYVVLVAKEALVGLAFAFILLIVFETIASVGALIDLARGATLANVLDPLTQNQQSLLARFFTQVAIVLFLTLGGIQLLLRGLADSFVLLPPHAFLPPRMVGPAATGQFVGMAGELFLIVFRLAAPAVVILLLLDFALGVINRVAPQIQVFFLGLTTKSVVGLLILLIGLSFLFDQIIEQLGRAIAMINGWLS